MKQTSASRLLRPIATFLLDANRINARQQVPEMNELECLQSRGLVVLLMAGPADEEARVGSAIRAKKVDTYVTLDTKAGVGTQFDGREMIEQIVFPAGALLPNEINDVHILEVARQTRVPLITNDGASKNQPGGMLGNADKLLTLGITVISATAALAHVHVRLRERLGRDAHSCCLVEQRSQQTAQPVAD